MRPRVGDGALAVGETDRAGFAQEANLGEFLATTAFGQGGVGEHGKRAGLLAARAHEADQGRVVDGWAAVG